MNERDVKDMNGQDLVKALREHAEWARANEWETPITLGDDLAEAADRIEAQAKEIDALRNKLCLKLRDQDFVSAITGNTGNSGWRNMVPQVDSSDFPTQWVPSMYEYSIIDAQAKEIETLRAHQQRIGMEGM